MPAITVAIPTHDRPEFLHRAVASVLGSTVQDFEICISDDGAHRPAETVVQCLADPRIRYRRRQSTGIADNWSAACEAASAPLVMKLDDDDEIAPSFLERTIAFLQAHPQVSVVYTAHTEILREGVERTVVDEGFWAGRETAEGYEYARALLLNEAYPKNHKSIGVFRREAAAEIGWFRRARLDLTFSLLISLGHEIGYIPEPLFRYHLHGTGSQGMGLPTFAALLDQMEAFFTWPEVRRHPVMLELQPRAEAAWRFVFPLYYLLRSVRDDPADVFRAKWQLTCERIPDFGPKWLVRAMLAAARPWPEPWFACLLQSYSRSRRLPALLNALRRL